MEQMQINDPVIIKGALKPSNRIAIVGLSPKTERDSNEIARYLMANGYEVVPVNPMVDEVLGMKSYKTLSDIPGKVDVVDVFRRSEEVPEISSEAIKIGAKYLWLQFGVIHQPAAEMAVEAGLAVIMDRCIKVEHAVYK